MKRIAYLCLGFCLCALLFAMIDSVSADICYEKYRLLDDCSGLYPQFVVAPARQDPLLNQTSPSDFTDPLAPSSPAPSPAVTSSDKDNKIGEAKLMSTQNIRESTELSASESQVLSGLSLSPGRGGREFVAAGSGSVQTNFDVGFTSAGTSFRNSETFRARGLFDLKISQGYTG